jgi:4-phospho-D-threonate 3-dehydrogenase / 4-phospho-D-erythronate 3-dehydrogenase
VGIRDHPDSLTMIDVVSLRVFFLARLVSFIERCSGDLARLGLEEGNLAVAGLNPHCGSQSLLLK